MAIQTPNNVTDTTGTPAEDPVDLSRLPTQAQADFLSTDQLAQQGWSITQDQGVAVRDGGETVVQDNQGFTVGLDGQDIAKFTGQGNAQTNFNQAASFVRQTAGPAVAANTGRRPTVDQGDLRQNNFGNNQRYKVVTVTGTAGDGSGDTVPIRKDVFNIGTGELAASFWNQDTAGDVGQLNNDLDQWLQQNRIGTTGALTGGESAVPLAGVIAFDTVETAPPLSDNFAGDRLPPNVADTTGFLPNITPPVVPLTSVNSGANLGVANTGGAPTPSAPTGLVRPISTVVNNVTGTAVSDPLRAVANQIRTITDQVTGTPVPITQTVPANPLIGQIQTAFDTDPRRNASLFAEIARNLNVAANSVTGQQAVQRFLSNNGLQLTPAQFDAFRSGTSLPASAPVLTLTGPINNIAAPVLNTTGLSLPAQPTQVDAPRRQAAAVPVTPTTSVARQPGPPVRGAPLQDIAGSPITPLPVTPTDIRNNAAPVSDFDFGGGEDLTADRIRSSPVSQDFGASDEALPEDFVDPQDINFDPEDIDNDPFFNEADDTDELFNDPFFNDDGDGLGGDEAAFTRGLTINAQNQVAINSQQGVQSNYDWRVKLQLAPGADYLYMDPDERSNSAGILYPLSVTNGVVFPYTPAIQTTYNANYSDYHLTHSNLRGLFYQSSYVDDVTITCPFTAQDTEEANYLLAVIHFFRSVTKMFYGQDAQRGVPPPLVYLTGLGEFQFNGHPCVVSSFTYSLPTDVDYIRARTSTIQGGVNLLYKRARQDLPVNASQASRQRLQTAGLNAGAQQPLRAAPPTLGVGTPTYVPTKMEVVITLKPVQSRTQVSQEFSLKQYANGSLLRKGFW